MEKEVQAMARIASGLMCSSLTNIKYLFAIQMEYNKIRSLDK